MLHNQIQERKTLLEQELNEILRQLPAYPSGSFSSVRNGKFTKWYISHPPKKGRMYLSKKKHDLAEKLAVKKYLEMRSLEIKAEISVLQSYLDSLPTILPSDELLANTNYHDLLSQHFQSVDAVSIQWQSQAYTGNPYHPEQLIHKTPAGYRVRSKSEVMIAMELQKAAIPHKYECPLTLNTRTIYPDFTLMHPANHKLYYWEHLGMMDDTSYAQEAARKIQRYISEGIYPGIQLILTSETAANPLDIEMIQRTIRMYLV